MIRRTRWWVPACLLVLVLCIVVLLFARGRGGQTTTQPDYTPISDKQLYSQISKLTGVTTVDISYLESLESGSSYTGKVSLGSGHDAVAVLDRAIAILRQGRWGSGVDLEIIAPQRTTSVSDLGLEDGTWPELEKRYGPQPGDGLPPAEPSTSS